MRPIRGHTYATENCQVTIETQAQQDAHIFKMPPHVAGRRSGYRGKCICGHSYGYDAEGRLKGSYVAFCGRVIGHEDSAMDLLDDITSQPVLASLGEKMRLRTGYRYAFRGAEGHVDITEMFIMGGATTGFRGKKDGDSAIFTGRDARYDPFGKSLNGNLADPSFPYDLVREIGPTPSVKSAANKFAQLIDALIPADLVNATKPADPALKVDIGKRYVLASGEIIGPMIRWNGRGYFAATDDRLCRLWNEKGIRYTETETADRIVREYVAPVKVEAGKRYAFRGMPGSVTISGNSQKGPDKWNGRPDAMAQGRLQPEQCSWNSEGRRHADKEDAFDLVKELPAMKAAPFYGYTVPPAILEQFRKVRDDMLMFGSGAMLIEPKGFSAMSFTVVDPSKVVLKPKTRLQKFDEQNAAKLNADRGKVYGDPKVHFSRSARIKAVIAECKHPEARHAMEMIADKMARIIETPDHLDSWQDIAGYARTGVMVTEPDKAKDFWAVTATNFYAQKKAAE
jgi:hypothetical protein